MNVLAVAVHRVVVVGGGYAGLLTAARLARQAGVEVTLVEPSPVFIERIRMHQWAAGQQPQARPLGELIAPGVRWVADRAVKLALAERSVRLAGGAVLGYDQLVLAIGSRIDRERVPGVAEHCLSWETAAQCRAVVARARRGGEAVVVGLGPTGVETACELAGAFPRLRVTLLGRGRLGEGLSPAGAEHLRAALARLAVTVIEGATVEAVRGHRLALRGGDAIGFDLCLWAAGFVAPGLAAQAGLPVAADGRVLVDGALRAVGHPEVLVVGDAAHVVCGADAGGPALRMACATAMPMGAHAAEQVLRRVRGQAPTPLRLGSLMLCLSLGRRDGLIQLLAPDDRPRPRIVRGRAAVLVKEAICRMTVVTLRAEARGIRLYHWPQAAAATTPALPAASAGVQS